MGQALARAFIANGHPTTVWNRTPAKAEELAAHGALPAATIADAITTGPLVVVCVLDYDAVDSILFGQAVRGRTLVNLTAGSPYRARETAAWAAEHGAGYLDGSIMTPASTIGRPAAHVLYSGSEAVYEAHRPTLASLGGTATYMGADPGRAAAYEVALLDIFWTSMSAIVHAFALAGAENVTAKEIAPYAQAGVGLLPGIIAEFAERIDEGRHPGDRSSIASAAAGMEHIIHAAQARGLDVGVLSAARAVTQRAIDAGYGSDGFSRLTQVLRTATGD